MKCLYISYDGALEPLGQSQIISYLKGLSKKGIEFVLLTFDKKNYRNKEDIYRFRESLYKNNIKWHSLSYHKNPPIISKIFDIIHGLIISIIISLREKFNSVHARGYFPSLIALALKKVFKVKFIFDMRGFWPDQKVESRHWSENGILYCVTKYFERKFIWESDEIVVLTTQAKEIIKRYNNTLSDKITVIPCCVDINIFKPDAKIGAELRRKNGLTGKLVFAHVGSFETGYIGEELIEYFKMAKEVIPSAHLLILSHYSNSNILESIEKKKINRDDFTILSSPFVEMPKYLSMIDVGTLFLSLGFSKYACSPTKFAEFLSCGIPVISISKIGDIEDCLINNKAGVIIRNFDSNEYKQSLSELLKLLEDSGLKARCRRLAEEKFSLEMGIDRYYGVYNRLKSKPPIIGSELLLKAGR